MAYHMNAETISLDDLRRRIETTDLVPSRTSLKDQIGEKMQVLEMQGIKTLAALRVELRNPRRLAALAQATGLDADYLNLLRREIEGYFPQPASLNEFDWLPGEEIEKLKDQQIRDTAALYEITCSVHKRSDLVNKSGVDSAVLEVLAGLVDLMRVQWVSPTFARMLLAAGYASAATLAAARAEALYDALAQINAGGRFYKGKIGLRDCMRLIQAAGYV